MFFFFLVIVVVVRKTRTLLCRHLNQTLMEAMEVTERLQTLLINIQVHNKDNTVTRSTGRVTNISIRTGSIHKVDMAVIINGVVMAAVIAINYFLFVVCVQVSNVSFL